jgi:hypothetical protein
MFQQMKWSNEGNFIVLDTESFNSSTKNVLIVFAKDRNFARTTVHVVSYITPRSVVLTSVVVLAENMFALPSGERGGHKAYSVKLQSRCLQNTTICSQNKTTFEVIVEVDENRHLFFDKENHLIAWPKVKIGKTPLFAQVFTSEMNC